MNIAKILLSAALMTTPSLDAQVRLGAPLIQLNDDGGWCWFEDERAIITGGKLILGTVASGLKDPSRRGRVEATIFDLKTRAASVVTLHSPTGEADRRQWYDDHNSPAFLPLPSGAILTAYAKHGPENTIYLYTSKPGDPAAWGQMRTLIPSPSSRVTYSNLHLLTAENAPTGRIYDFFRGLNNSFKPSYVYSDDLGQTWTTGAVFINVPSEFRHRPYVKYASNGRDTVHIAYTEGHPRDFDNSIYHVFYRASRLHYSTGAPLAPLADGLKSPTEGTLVFKGDPNNVAWITDLAIDAQGHPYLVFSVQKDSAGKPPRSGGDDHRYHYARFNGKTWTQSEIAYAGTRIYAGEDDYTGLAALDPHDPSILYISTNAHPVSGAPLISKTDGKRHWEIFEGKQSKDGKWSWTPITKDSTSDNLRPIVPRWDGPNLALLWLQGEMRAYTDYSFRVVGMIGPRAASK